MASEKDISSTEMLLKVIRGGETGSSPRPEDLSRPGLPERIRSRLFSSGGGGAVGVEIFQDSVNLAKVTGGRAGREVAAGACVRLPAGMGIGHPGFPAWLKERIRSVAGPGRHDIWLSLPAAGGEVWNARVPKVRKGLSNAVFWSARKEKPFNEDEYVFDYLIKGERVEDGVSKLYAEVSIASISEIERYRRLFSGIGYPLKGITLPSFAIRNLFQSGWVDPGDGPYAVLFIGVESSHVNIYDREGLLFSRAIRAGREGFAETDRDTEDTEAHSPFLDRLVRQVERTVDHSVNIQGNAAPERLYVCGGASSMPGLIDRISEHLGIPVDPLDVLSPGSKALSPFMSPPSPEQRLSLASTAGLAAPSAKTLNFLHTALDRDRQRVALRKTGLVAGFCAVLFMLTAGLWWAGDHRLKEARSRVSDLEAQLRQYPVRVTREEVMERAGEVGRHRALAREYGRKLLAPAVLKELGRMTPEGVFLSGMRLDMGAPRNRPASNSGGTVILEGLIRGDPAGLESQLAGYLLILRHSPLFGDSAIISSRPESLDSGEEVLRFTLDIKIKGMDRNDPMV